MVVGEARVPSPGNRPTPFSLPQQNPFDDDEMNE